MNNNDKINNKHKLNKHANDVNKNSENAEGSSTDGELVSDLFREKKALADRGNRFRHRRKEGNLRQYDEGLRPSLMLKRKTTKDEAEMKEEEEKEFEDNHQNGDDILQEKKSIANRWNARRSKQKKRKEKEKEKDDKQKVKAKDSNTDKDSKTEVLAPLTLTRGTSPGLVSVSSNGSKKQKKNKHLLPSSTKSLVEAVPVANAQIATNKIGDIEASSQVPSANVQQAEAVEATKLPWWKRQNPYCLLAVTTFLAVLIGVSIYLGITFGGGRNNNNAILQDDDNATFFNDNNTATLPPENETMTPNLTAFIPDITQPPLFALDPIQADEQQVPVIERLISLFVDISPSSQAALESNVTFLVGGVAVRTPQRRAIDHLISLHSIQDEYVLVPVNITTDFIGNDTQTTTITNDSDISFLEPLPPSNDSSNPIPLPLLPELQLSNNTTIDLRPLPPLPQLDFIEVLARTASEVLDDLDPSMLVRQFALLTLFYSTGGGEFQWLDFSGWLFNTNECNWFGIVCNNTTEETNNLDFNTTGTTNEVMKIVLSGNNLIGTVPHEVFGILFDLMHLDLSENRLTGTLPFIEPTIQDESTTNSTSPANVLSLMHLNVSGNSELQGDIVSIFNLIKERNGTLSGLTHLDLAQTLVTGSLFDALSTTTNDTGTTPFSLQHLQLGRDARLQLQRSSLPSNGLERWSQLTHLQVEEFLEGQLPTQIAQLQNLKVLNLANNLLVGTLPSELGYLNGTLTQLELQFNFLSGTLPIDMVPLTKLEILHLFDNFGLRGSLDNLRLENYVNLQRIDVSSTRLSGTLPMELFELSSLVHANFGNSRFSGSLPTQLGQLKMLQVLDLENNDFTGSFPTEVGELANIRLLDCSRNRLAGFIPMEFGNLFTTLETLDLRTNDLSGLFPVVGNGEAGFFENVSDFQISGNNLFGPLPFGLCGGVDCGPISCDCGCCGCFCTAGLIVDDRVPTPLPFVFEPFFCVPPGEERDFPFPFEPPPPQKFFPPPPQLFLISGPEVLDNATIEELSPSSVPSMAPSVAPSFAPSFAPSPDTCELDLNVSCGEDGCSSSVLDLPDVRRCTDTPTQIRFRYNGGNCSQSTTLQPSPIFTCIDTEMQDANNITKTVFIVASDVVSGLVYFARDVNVTDFFTVRESEALGGRMNITIYSSSTTVAENVIQTVEFASSCGSRSFDAGDKFGAVQVVSFTNAEQRTVSVLRFVTFSTTIRNLGECSLASLEVTRETISDGFFAPPEATILENLRFLPITAFDGAVGSFSTLVQFDLSVQRPFTLLNVVSGASFVSECVGSANVTIFGGTPLSVRHFGVNV